MGACCCCVSQDAGFVVREAYEAVAEAAQQYEEAGPGPLRMPGEARLLCFSCPCLPGRLPARCRPARKRASCASLCVRSALARIPPLSLLKPHHS